VLFTRGSAFVEYFLCKTKSPLLIPSSCPVNINY